VVRVGAGGLDEGHVEAAADVEALAVRDELRRLAVGRRIRPRRGARHLHV